MYGFDKLIDAQLMAALSNPQAYMIHAVKRELLKRKTFSASGKPPTRYMETCPNCERRNVNLYLQDGKWLCKKCWDALEKDWVID